MYYRCIAPEWLLNKNSNKKKVLEGEFTEEEILNFNEDGYNIYYLPNYPSIYHPGTTADGSQIDTFNYVFVDMDMKDGIYKSKSEFLNKINDFGVPPTMIVDSGNGVHVYWQVSDLDAASYLRLQRRLTRKFNTDEAVSKIFQLMRVPGTINTKREDSFKLCEIIAQDNTNVYTADYLDKELPPITLADEQYCQTHFDRTYHLKQQTTKIPDKMPLKFAKLVKANSEVRDIWSHSSEDRSGSDWRLGHIMFTSGFTRDEAIAVLVNAPKALERAPVHQLSYAQGIVDKIWTYELEDKFIPMSKSVKDILVQSGDKLRGTRFKCWDYLDDTLHGWRLGHVVGLIAGSGVGKTAMALNMFEGFVERNPQYDHLFVSLEQPKEEIAERWRNMCGSNTSSYDKVHILDNYDEEGNFRHLTFPVIQDYVMKYQKNSERRIGSVVIDHIGIMVPGKKDLPSEIMEICHAMKKFAQETQTLIVMQSQSPRDKAGIGDIELNKDAAYGTALFEWYCDYVITIWQPLKRCYKNPACPTVMAYKFCKIRHKKQGFDTIKEDERMIRFFDPVTERLRELTQAEEQSFTFFNTQATNIRKLDSKTEVLSYTSYKKVEVPNGAPDNSTNSTRIAESKGVSGRQATSGVRR
jgi:KaiC/GvpD/RAD55 family RecA-like ATPase